MKWNRVRVMATAVVTALLLSSLGCIVAADAFNPEFFVGLGLDPGTIFPQVGTVIVSFTNNTTYPALFYGFESVSATDLTVDTRNFSVNADPGESRNEVLTCPVGVTGPGSVSDAFAIETLAATVYADSSADVEYLGAPLYDSVDFNCGDVIDIQLYAPAADGADYQLVIRVLPG